MFKKYISLKLESPINKTNPPKAPLKSPLILQSLPKIAKPRSKLILSMFSITNNKLKYHPTILMGTTIALIKEYLNFNKY